MWYFLLLLQNMPDILDQPYDTVGTILPTHGTIWGSLSSSGGVRQRYSLSFAASVIFVHLRRYLFRQVRPYTVGQGILSTVTPKSDQMSSQPHVRNITHYTQLMKNLAFHSSLRWEIIIATNNSQYLIYMHFFWKVGRMYVFELGNEKVKQRIDSSQRRFS